MNRNDLIALFAAASLAVASAPSTSATASSQVCLVILCHPFSGESALFGKTP